MIRQSAYLSKSSRWLLSMTVPPGSDDRHRQATRDDRIVPSARPSWRLVRVRLAACRQVSSAECRQCCRFGRLRAERL